MTLGAVPARAVAVSTYRGRLRRNLSSELRMRDTTDRRRARQGWGVFVHDTRGESVAVLFKRTAQMSTGLDAWDDPFVNVRVVVFQTWELGATSKMVQFSPAASRDTECEVLRDGAFVPLACDGDLGRRFSVVKRRVRDALAAAPTVRIAEAGGGTGRRRRAL